MPLFAASISTHSWRSKHAAAVLALAVAAAALPWVPVSASSKDPGVTAEFSAVPASHDGSVFSFQVAFSPEPDLSYVTLRDQAFTVEGGEVVRAARLVRGSNAGWMISVEPELDDNSDPVGDVTVVLPVTAACDDDGAICTTGGLRLSNRTEATIPGPQTQQNEPTEETTAEEDTTGGESSGESSTEETTAEEDTTGGESSGESSTESDSGEEDTTGGESSGESSTESDSGEEDTTGGESSGESSTESDSGEEDTTGGESSGEGSTGGESGEGTTGESSGEGSTGGESGEGTTGESSGEGSTGGESTTGESSGEGSTGGESGEGTTGESSGEGSTGGESGEGTTGESSGEGSTGGESGEGTTGESSGEGSSESDSGEETTGEVTTGGETTGEVTTGESTTGEDAIDSDALAAREAQAGRITDLGDVTEVSVRRFLRSSTGQRSAGEPRYFRFEVTEAVLARVGLRALEGDVDLYLENAAGHTLASSTNPGSNDEDLEIRLDSGEYFIRVVTRRDWRIRFGVRYEMDEPPPQALPVGSLHPVAQLQAQGPSEGGKGQISSRQGGTDTCANGTSTTCTITIGTPESNSIESGGDVDWFRVTLDANTLYHMTVDGGSGPGNLGSTAQVNVHHENSRSAHLRGFVVPRFASRASTDPQDLVFYIVVSSSSTTATGAYTVTLSARTDDCGASTSSTCQAVLNGFRTFYIEQSGDIDWIKTPSLIAGTAYRFEFQLPQDKRAVTGGGKILGVYKSDGSRIAFTEGQRIWSPHGRLYERFGNSGNRDYQVCRSFWPQVTPGELCGEINYEVPVFTAPATGHYFVAVAADNGLVGSYALGMRRFSGGGSPYRNNSRYSYPDGHDDPPTSLPSGPRGTAQAIPAAGLAVGGYMPAYGVRNWHVVTLTADRSYEITVTPRAVQDSAGETVHRGLWNPMLVGLADGAGAEYPRTGLANTVGSFGDRQHFTPTTTGTYYIIVQSGPVTFDSGLEYTSTGFQWEEDLETLATTGEYLLSVRLTG